MTLKTRIIPCLDVKDASGTRSGSAARTRKTFKGKAVR
jgi:imidazole glycerol phosphate synthase subunit HisF